MYLRFFDSVGLQRRKLVWEQLGKIDNMFKTRNYHEVPEEFRDGDEHVKPSFTQQTNYDLLLIAFCASFYLLLPKDWKSLPRMSELRTKATRTVYQIPFHTSLYDARTLLKEETCELLTAIMYQYQNTPRPAPSPTDGQPEAIRVAQRLAEAARGTHTFFPKPRQLINSLAGEFMSGAACVSRCRMYRNIHGRAVQSDDHRAY